MTEDTITPAVREYLEVLDRVSGGETRSYFPSLYAGDPIGWAAMVRNIRYGLEHFRPGSVIDLGCGHGLQAYVFALHGRDVVGVDLNEDWVDLARRATKELGIDVEFRVGDAKEELRTLDGGAVWMHRSIGHIQYLPDFFRVARKALQPDGSFVFMTSNSASRALLPGVRRGQYSVKRMGVLLRDAGFRVIDVEYHGYLTAVPPRYRPPRAVDLEEALSRVPLLSRMGGSFSMTAATV
jgi:SAM-dependent methyltransferase